MATRQVANKAFGFSLSVDDNTGDIFLPNGVLFGNYKSSPQLSMYAPASPVSPNVKAAVDQLLGLWGTSNSKGSHQRVIRDFTNAADDVPVDTTGGTEEQRLQWAMKVLQGGTEAYPFFSKKGAGGWESVALPFSKAYAPASKIYSEWVPDYQIIGETGMPEQGPVDYSRWAQIAPQLGFNKSPYVSLGYDSVSEGGGELHVVSPEFVQFVDQKRSEGYDFVQKRSNFHNYNNYTGFKLPSGEVVGQSKYGDDDDIKSFFTDFVLPAASAAFTMGGGLNALTSGGAAAAPANALTGASLGAMEGVGLSGNIVNAATGQTIASLPTAAMTAADIGRGLGDVLGQASQAPGLEVMDLAPLESAVTNVTTPAAAATDAANAMRLGDLTQLQANPQLAQQAMDLAGGSADLVPGVMGGGQFSAAGNVLAPAAAGGVVDNEMAKLLRQQAAVQAGTSALGGIGPGATALPGVSTGLTGIPALDKAIDLVTSPAGQAVVGAVGSVAGGVMQANAAEAAANQQAEAARNALQLQREMFEYQKGLLEPYRTAGTAALKRLEGALGLGGTAQAQQMLEMDPGYGFRLGEGMKALERMQAARGNMLSGGALKAGQRYAQDYASGEYGNAYNRLANIAGLGQTVGGQLGSAAQQFGTSAGNVMGQEANALAAGRYGRTSAYTDALGGVLGAYENYLNRGQRNQLARDIYGRMLGGGG